MKIVTQLFFVGFLLVVNFTKGAEVVDSDLQKQIDILLKENKQLKKDRLKRHGDKIVKRQQQVYQALKKEYDFICKDLPTDHFVFWILKDNERLSKKVTIDQGELRRQRQKIDQLELKCYDLEQKEITQRYELERARHVRVALEMTVRQQRNHIINETILLRPMHQAAENSNDVAPEQ